MKQRKLSNVALLVLDFIAASKPQYICGADIIRQLGVGPGTLYPMLQRFEWVSWISGKWENIDPKKIGRPRKYLYRMTALGEKYLSSCGR